MGAASRWRFRRTSVLKCRFRHLLASEHDGWCLYPAAGRYSGNARGTVTPILLQHPGPIMLKRDVLPLPHGPISPNAVLATSASSSKTTHLCVKARDEAKGQTDGTGLQALAKP